MRSSAVFYNAVAIAARLSTVSSFSSSVAAKTARRTIAQSTSLFSAPPPTRYLLNYEYIPDVLEKRGPYREGHLGLAKAMAEEGTCVSGGPSNLPGSDVPYGALCKSLKVLIVLSLRSKLTILLSPVVFTTKDAAEKFAKEDPYVEGGIVTRSTISEWTVAIGSN